jgi:hypothetical protein
MSQPQFKYRLELEILVHSISPVLGNSVLASKFCMFMPVKRRAVRLTIQPAFRT